MENSDLLSRKIERCPCCGGPVTKMGKDTKYYVSVDERELLKFWKEYKLWLGDNDDLRHANQQKQSKKKRV